MNEQLVDDLKACKAYMQEHGQCHQGMGDTRTGPGCLVVSISHAIAYRVGCYDFRPYDFSRHNPRRLAVWGAIGEHLPQDRVRPGEGIDLIGFNEHPDTTDEDVLMVFDKAIVEAGGMV